MRLLKRSRRLILISRPLSWILGPLLFIYPFISQNQIPGIIPILHLILFSFPFSFMLFGINDIYDHDTDRKNPRKNSLVHGAIISRKEFGMVKMISGMVAIALILVALAAGNVTVILTISLILLSIAYSARPIRLKELPPLDSLSNAAMIYLIVAIGASHLGNGFVLPNFFDLIFPLLIGVVSIHMFSTIMDFTPDKKAGVKTAATVFGKSRTATLAIIIMAFALLNINTADWFIMGYLSFSMVTMAVYIIIRKERAARMASVAQAVAFVICAIGSMVT